MLKWARLPNLKPGDVLIADSGFTCLADEQRCRVEADEAGKLFVRCGGPTGRGRASRHFLAGQAQTPKQVLVGMVRA